MVYRKLVHVISAIALPHSQRWRASVSLSLVIPFSLLHVMVCAAFISVGLGKYLVSFCINRVPVVCRSRFGSSCYDAIYLVLDLFEACDACQMMTRVLSDAQGCFLVKH